MTILRLACNGLGNYSITPEEKKLAKELGLVRGETAIAELLRIAQVLKSNGIDLRKIKLSKNKNGKTVEIKLSEIKQEGIDIDKIIEANRFRSRFSIWTESFCHKIYI